MDSLIRLIYDKDTTEVSNLIGNLCSGKKAIDVPDTTEEEDIKHMVKLKSERLELEFDRKCQEYEKKKFEEIAKVKDDYRNKMEKHLEQGKTELKEMYSEILSR